MKRTLSIILCVIILLSAFSCYTAAVSAEEITDETTGSETVATETAETVTDESGTVEPEIAETGTDEPVLPHGPEGSWNAWESGHPGIFEDDDGTVYLFYQGKATLKGDYQLSCLKVEFVD